MMQASKIAPARCESFIIQSCDELFGNVLRLLAAPLRLYSRMARDTASMAEEWCFIISGVVLGGAFVTGLAIAFYPVKGSASALNSRPCPMPGNTMRSSSKITTSATMTHRI